MVGTASRAGVTAARVEAGGDGLCPVFASVELVGTKWRLLVVHHLLAGPKRYSELLHANPGLSSKTLTATLKTLESAGLVERRVLPVRPVSVVYELTEEGHALAPVVQELRRWGAQRVLPRVAQGDPRLVSRFQGPHIQ